MAAATASGGTADTRNRPGAAEGATSGAGGNEHKVAFLATCLPALGVRPMQHDCCTCLFPAVKLP